MASRRSFSFSAAALTACFVSAALSHDEKRPDVIVESSPKDMNGAGVVASSFSDMPNLLNVENNRVGESAFDPGFNVVMPISIYTYSDMYTPGAHYATLTGPQGDIVYTFKPQNDEPRAPNFGDLVQAYTTSDVNFVFTQGLEGTLSGDADVTVRLTPIDVDQVQRIGMTATKEMMSMLEAVAVTPVELTQELYRQYNELEPTSGPSFEDISEFVERTKSNEPVSAKEVADWRKKLSANPATKAMPVSLVESYGVVASVLKAKSEDNPDGIAYSLYSYKSASDPQKGPQAPAPALPLDINRLPESQKKIILVSDMRFTNDPDHPGDLIMRGKAHFTARKELILFGTAQTAFAAGEYVTHRKKDVPTILINLVSVVREGNEPEPVSEHGDTLYYEHKAGEVAVEVLDPSL